MNRILLRHGMRRLSPRLGGLTVDNVYTRPVTVFEHVIPLIGASAHALLRFATPMLWGPV